MEHVWFSDPLPVGTFLFCDVLAGIRLKNNGSAAQWKNQAPRLRNISFSVRFHAINSKSRRSRHLANTCIVDPETCWPTVLCCNSRRPTRAIHHYVNPLYTKPSFSHLSDRHSKVKRTWLLNDRLAVCSPRSRGLMQCVKQDISRATLTGKEAKWANH